MIVLKKKKTIGRNSIDSSYYQCDHKNQLSLEEIEFDDERWGWAYVSLSKRRMYCQSRIGAWQIVTEWNPTR